jgi:hypothetical protein
VGGLSIDAAGLPSAEFFLNDLEPGRFVVILFSSSS